MDAVVGVPAFRSYLCECGIFTCITRCQLLPYFPLEDLMYQLHIFRRLRRAPLSYQDSAARRRGQGAVRELALSNKSSATNKVNCT